jgi:Leucine-rich repeat (LRR) protein
MYLRLLLQTIEGLANYTNLRALDLSCHLIARIEGLSSLKQLMHLSLADNKIGVLQGLNRLHSLEELDLSGNSIETIGTGLESLSKLRVLRLARNRISQVRCNAASRRDQLFT